MASVLLFHLNAGKTHVAVDFIHLKTDQLMLSPSRTDLAID